MFIPADKWDVCTLSMWAFMSNYNWNIKMIINYQVILYQLLIKWLIEYFKQLTQRLLNYIVSNVLLSTCTEQ